MAFSPDGTRLATASADNTARIWDLTGGACLVTLIPLTEENGYATLFDGAYKLEGDPDDRLWWAIKLCRFAPGSPTRTCPDCAASRRGKSSCLS